MLNSIYNIADTKDNNQYINFTKEGLTQRCI